MRPDLVTFLTGRMVAFDDSVVWMPDRLPLRIACYRAASLPPPAFVTSVRCLVTRAGTVLVQRDRTTTHILPGGRREAGERADTTLRREVLEETGWALGTPRLLGFMHFHDPNPALPDHPYAYPDFLQVVYTAEAVALIPDARVDDGYELSSDFLALTDVRHLPISARERFFLDAAME